MIIILFGHYGCVNSSSYVIITLINYRRRIMQSFIETHRKEIITGAGVLLFMIAGSFAMFITKSVTSEPVQETQTKNQNAIIESKSEPEPQPKRQESVKEIYVYVTGAVKKPGVYKFPEGSRIFEAIDSAGGFTPKADISALNLAETFSDAQHIHIPVKGERSRTNANANADTYTHVTVQPTESKTSKSNAKSSGNTGLVDVNNASENELQRLNGVGPAIAKRIYEYRQKNGRFKSAEELINVRGIGPARLEKMRSQILIR